MIRPYWVRGIIEWRYPNQVPAWLYGLFNNSTLVRFVRARWNLAWMKLSGTTIEMTLTQKDPRFTRAVNTTSAILAMARKRVGPSVPIVAFDANACPWGPDSVFERISRENGVEYISGLSDAIEKRKKAGEAVDFSPQDVHWNASGHKIAGQIIYEYLRRKRLLSAV